jgi:hypothetical protein
MFDIEVAKQVGVVAAILFQNIAFWCMHCEANGTNYHDGLYWTYNTNKAFCELFPYMSSKTIRNALQKLVDAGLIVTGNYNEKAYDRTIWYALSQKGKCIFQKGQMDIPERANAISQKGEPIPYINTDINPDINTDINVKRTRFTRPTADELTAYANEIDYNLRVQVFLDYYDGNGWMVGKNHMKDWKATVRQWKRRDEERGIDVHARRSEPTREDILASLTPEQQRIIDGINARGENFG